MSEADLLNPALILDDLWSRLFRSAEDPKHPWHWPAVAMTDRDGQPTIRTMVLREASHGARSLTFFTDVRSPKIRMLRVDPRIALCFNDVPAGIQLRIAASAEILSHAPIVDECWNTVPPPTRAAYAQSCVPGTAVDEWMPKRASSADEGRENFAVIRCVVSEIDWLKLDPAGHFRMRFTFAADGSMQSSWLAP